LKVEYAYLSVEPVHLMQNQNLDFKTVFVSKETFVLFAAGISGFGSIYVDRHRFFAKKPKQNRNV
jgi:hypothetical protein